MPISRQQAKRLFDRTEHDLRTLSSERQADSIHKFRTTTRRLQTLLEQLVPERNRNQKKLLKMLDHIRRLAGKVRDLDVELAALRSLKVSQEPRRKTQLLEGLIELRSEHEKKLRKMLTKEMVRQIRKRLSRASKEVRVESGRDPMDVAQKILQQVEPAAAAPLTEELLHRYRIAVKRARYAAEFAPKSGENLQFIARLQRLQDVLGHWHDWMILTRRAARRFGDAHQSSLVAALDGVTRGKFRHAAADLVASAGIRSRKRSPAASRPGKRVTKSVTSADQTDSAA